MNTIDLIIFIAYCLLILCVGLFVSRGRKGDERDAGDYFLAGRGLAWWAIGASIIASNISAEQFVGMSGSGYAIGLAMATYEWIAALGLILVAKFFIPIFLEKKIFTMPQFLEERFDKCVKTVMAVFWLAVFIFINLTSILYLGALTIEKVMGIPMLYGIIGLAAFAGIYSIYGGLKAVALTDVVQVVFLVGGGLVTTYIALDLLGEGGGVYQGMVNLYGEASDKFHLILDKSHPGYKDLPGISVILGGLWVANLYYWGCNQYIIQRALAAKSVREAQNGMLFAGFIKLFIPLLVVIPGIAAFALEAPLEKSDEAYPWLLGNLLPVGVSALNVGVAVHLAGVLHAGQDAAGDVQRLEQGVVPVQRADIVQHGAAGVGAVGNVHLAAGQLPDQPSVHRAEQKLPGLGLFPRTGDVFQDPLDLGGREIGVRHKASVFPDIVRHAGGLEQLVHKGRGAAALPDDGVIHRASGALVPQDGGLALVGDANARNVLGVYAALGDYLVHHAVLAGPDLHGVVLHPALMGVDLLKFPLLHADNVLLVVKQDRPAAGSALIQ